MSERLRSLSFVKGHRPDNPHVTDHEQSLQLLLSPSYRLSRRGAAAAGCTFNPPLSAPLLGSRCSRGRGGGNYRELQLAANCFFLGSLLRLEPSAGPTPIIFNDPRSKLGKHTARHDKRALQPPAFLFCLLWIADSCSTFYCALFSSTAPLRISAKQKTLPPTQAISSWIRRLEAHPSLFAISKPRFAYAHPSTTTPSPPSFHPLQNSKDAGSRACYEYVFGTARGRLGSVDKLCMKLWALV